MTKNVIKYTVENVQNKELNKSYILLQLYLRRTVSYKN